MQHRRILAVGEKRTQDAYVLYTWNLVLIRLKTDQFCVLIGKMYLADLFAQRFCRAHNQNKTQSFLCCVLVFSRKEGDYAKFRQIRITKSSAFDDWSYRKVGLYGPEHEQTRVNHLCYFCASGVCLGLPYLQSTRRGPREYSRRTDKFVKLGKIISLSAIKLQLHT